MLRKLRQMVLCLLLPILKEKPSWLDIASLAINFGLFVVALLALILR